MKKAKKIMKVMIILLVAFIVVLVAIYINHGIKLNKEGGLKTPLGDLVEVNGYKMSVYVEGDGDKTIVFMSGGGTFSAFSLIRSTSFNIVVVAVFS